jgi:NADH-quinone oxidoreductase subunit L
MDGDDEERRYFAYMSLFVFSMLLLVQAGTSCCCSRLGPRRPRVVPADRLLARAAEAIAAAKKAFVMNAFGDATMALAFFVLIWQTGSLNFDVSFQGAATLSQTTVNLVALGLLGGAVAKSAQIPLHTWLPDAMEGPTPVSA